MRHLILISLAIFAFSSCNTGTEKKQDITSVSVEELIANPDEFKDMELAVSGMVTHVCRHGGQKCFIVGEDGETQIRIVPAGDIAEFSIDLEGSQVAFKGSFRVMNQVEAEAHVEEHDSKEHHAIEMSHSKAEKADIFLEASEMKEITD